MGQVGRPHGIRGELSVDWVGEYVPKPHDTVVLQQNGGSPMPFRVNASRWHKGRLLLGLDGIADRTAAQNFTGLSIFMAKSALPPLGDDEAFLNDLPGYDVFMADGVYLGVIGHLEFPAGQPLWAICDKSGRELLFPAHEHFIKTIDASAHKVVIDPPEGLLEIYFA